MRMFYVEYSRDRNAPKEVTDKKVVDIREFNKLKKLSWINIIHSEELTDDWAVKNAKKDEWSKYDSEVFESGDYPVALASVGFSRATRWTYTQYNQFLCAYNIKRGIEITFNLEDVENIKNKLNYLYSLRRDGRLSSDDISELEERLRTLSTLEVGGNSNQSLAGISESTKHAKGKEYITYTDGIKKKHVARGSSKHSTDAQKKAAENARKYAWTESARKKRRKSISARSDGKIMKEI